MSADEFFPIWLANTKKYSDAPIYTFGPEKHPSCESLCEYPNIGHIDYLNSQFMTGWTAGFLIGLMHAYVNNYDFVHKEQDCLWFGDCVGQMYKQVGIKGSCYGKNKVFNSAIALMLVKHHHIPAVIHKMTEIADTKKYPEIKIRELNDATTYDFGYDRDRPFTVDDVFYIQQISTNDFQQIKHLL
jgi:hypothetical protein